MLSRVCDLRREIATFLRQFFDPGWLARLTLLGKDIIVTDMHAHMTWSRTLVYTSPIIILSLGVSFVTLAHELLRMSRMALHLFISINDLLISINELLISINELLIAINELLISMKMDAVSGFIDINKYGLNVKTAAHRSSLCKGQSEEERRAYPIYRGDWGPLGHGVHWDTPSSTKSPTYRAHQMPFSGSLGTPIVQEH